MKKAFTLAEVMIVLAIIGILVAILLPTAQNLTPDENLLKFKKANTTLTTAIRELVNSDKYYYDGDLGLDKEGNKIVEPKYFCSTLADILTTKKVECSDNNLGYNTSALANLPNIETDEIDGIKIYEYADCMCKNNTTSGEEIVLSDNTIIYTINPYYHFGSLIDGSDKRLFNLCSNEKRYKFICLDIDNLNEGEDPFGYALRADGKIIYGARAQAWLERKINGDSEIAIATTDSCAPTALAITPENDVCKVIQQPVVTPTPTPEPQPIGCGDLAIEIEIDGEIYCMTKYNIGDNLSLPLASGITKATAGTDTCAPSETKYCCWQGTTSTDCDSENGGYSGCTRTVCDWRASNKACEKLEYLGKDWHLPTNAQWTAVGNQINDISVGQSTSGMMLCDNQSGYSSARCRYAERCSGSYNGYCNPRYVWSGDTSGSSVCDYHLDSGVWYGPYSHEASDTSSVRCIAKADSVRPPSPCKNVDCGELAMCIELSNTKAICMTKYNIGDKPELPIASGVFTATAGSDTCTPSTNMYCCWKGTTSTSCDSANGDYSGCTRTVCDWRAGNASCNSLTYAGKTWRLPTSEEMGLIATQINAISAGQGAAGLMLCDGVISGSSSKCATAKNCSGSDNGFCQPYDVWTSKTSDNKAYEGYLNNGVLKIGADLMSHAVSVRCVADLH